MKKFLSLLLALTLVLSLVVVPARAETVKSGGSSDGTPATSSATLTWSANPSITVKSGETTVNSVTKGASLTFKVEPLTVTKQGSSPAELGTDYTVSYEWSNLPGGLAPADSATITGTTNAAGTFSNVTCAVTVKTVPAEGGTVVATKNATATVTVNEPVFSVNDIAKVIYKGRESVVTGATVAIPYFTAGVETSTLDNTGWRALFKSGSVFSYKDCSFNNNQLTVNANEGGTSPVVLTITPTPTTPDFNVNSDISIAKNASINLTATNYNRANVTPTYKWSYSYGDSKGGNIGTGATINKWKPTIASGTTYPVAITVKCETYEGSPEVKTAEKTFTLTVTNDSYVVTAPTIGKLLANDTKTVTLTPGTNFKFYKEGDVKMDQVPGATYKYTSSNSSVVAIGESTGVLSAKSAGTASITITVSYQGAEYTKTFPVTVVSPTVTLDSIYCGSTKSYSATELKRLAAGALATEGLAVSSSTALTGLSSVVVTSGGTSSTVSTTTSGSDTIFRTYGGYLGKPTLTATVTRTDGSTYTMSFAVPVIPIYNQTFEAQYPQAVSAVGNTYNYTVTAPTGYDRIALITKGTTPTTAQLTTMPAYNSTSITLNSNDFNTSTGKCMLYVMAWNSNWTSNYYSTGKYYYGPLEVYQKNHDIKYNGVVGNTVQFKHNDFTTFMNEMYGTNTTSYLTFNSVKFTSVPNATSQGTLYYSGSAMTTGYGSNYFNTNTAVANLDNVSFAVSSKVPSTTKEIRIPFTLYATRYNSYGSYGTGSGTSVTYSGAVVISLVREDVTFTVAPGDAVTFTDGAFLNYLRAQSGINYNYNIDYVTFDQSAVDTINGGVLYSGYAGYNQVKTTDKFYYTTTNNYTQNALSDVTFRASLYAKTGTTVYIPFTIYAKYGTSSAATRQVTGTVAVKIAQTMNFVDVKPTDYFYNPVKWAVGKNITKGTSAVTFSPDKTCTRAEIVTFLWRDAGSPMPTISRNPFSDVSYSMGADFYNAILWASQNGITAGTTTTTFSPNKTCTRAEIVTFLWRYAKKPVGYGSNSFTDVNKNDHAPYYDAILWAVSKGITNGSTTTTFAPNGTCTRAQAVTFLYRYEGGK